MKYPEKKKTITYLKKCKKKSASLKFSYKNVHLLIQMIFTVKDLMKEYDENRRTNGGLNQVVQTYNKELRELVFAKTPSEIKENFYYTSRTFQSDLNYCLMVFGVDPFVNE